MLWDQQVQIAVYTAPNAISKTVGERQMHMVPTAPLCRLAKVAGSMYGIIRRQSNSFVNANSVYFLLLDSILRQ